MKKIAILGAAFNPPTKGHLDVILQCLAHFDACWLIPSFSHAFGKSMLAYNERLYLCEQFIKDINQPQVSLMAIEQALKKEGPVYSYDLMLYLETHCKPPNSSFIPVFGPDNAKHWDKFYRANALAKRWPPFFAKERVKIRSTTVRETLKHDSTACKKLLTPKVYETIQQRSLYK